MRPLLKLLGRAEVQLDGSPADVKLTRKLWYVLALLAIAPDAEMLRAELTALSWPLSDERSRDVLMHKWRKTAVDAFAELGVSPIIVISERFVKFDTTLVTIDYIECLRIGNTLLSSQSAAATLEAAIEFDALASDQILLSGYPEAFETQRTEFDALRIQCLERGWKAAVTCSNNEAATQFADRLRKLGYTGDLYIEADAEEFGVGNKAEPRNFSQVIAALLLTGLFLTPIVLGRINQPKPSTRATGNPIMDQPPTYIGRYIQYEYIPKPADQVILSEAVATVKLPDGGAITTGIVRLKNLDQQILTVKTSRNRKVTWSTLTPTTEGVQYFPADITTDKFGNIFVGAHVQILDKQKLGRRPGRYNAVLKYKADGHLVSSDIGRQPEDKSTHLIRTDSNLEPVSQGSRDRAPGRYIALLKFDARGKLLAKAVSGKPQENVMGIIRVVSDLQGGAWLFTSGQNGSKNIRLNTMHLMASGEFVDRFPLAADFTEFNSVSQGASGENYIACTKFNFKRVGNVADWQVQRYSKAGKLEWTTVIDSPAKMDDYRCDLVVATNGDLLVYGPLATRTFDGVVRSLPTVMRLDAATGKIKTTDQTQTHFLRSNVLLTLFPGFDMYIVGCYDLAQLGSNSVYFYRSRPSANLSSLAMAVGLPRKLMTRRIVGMYFRERSGSFSALMQPLEGPGQRLALIYINKYFGTDISTGILTTDRQVHYNKSDNSIVAGRIGNNFAVFDFTGLK